MNNITWSEDQKEALRVLKNGTSAFITGGAGTGKSTLTKAFCGEKKIATLATTGAAAVLIGGQTIHSFMGIPPHIHHPGDITEGRREINMRALRKLASFDGVLIDEVSMMRVDLFQAVIETLGMAKNMRGGKPFQLVTVGDFAQLPPVFNDEERRVLRESYGSSVFAFQHKAWDAMAVHELSVIHRQAADSEYAQWLAGVRHGRVENADLVNARVGQAPETAVRLVATNASASVINETKMDELGGRDVVLRGRLTGNFNPSNVRVPESFRMRRGARVIICKNDMQAGYVNGSTGIITEIGMSKKGKLFSKVRLDTGKEVLVKEAVWEQISYERGPAGTYEPVVRGTYTQMPLLPGWAITIHRSQGMSLDCVHADPKGIFVAGQAYVALSRATSISGLSLENPVDVEDLYPDPRVMRYHASIRKEDLDTLPFSFSL